MKLAFEEIYKISELNEDVCFMECDSCNDCSFVYEETGICKWKHADEVEEVLKKMVDYNKYQHDINDLHVYAFHAALRCRIQAVLKILYRVRQRTASQKWT